MVLWNVFLSLFFTGKLTSHPSYVCAIQCQLHIPASLTVPRAALSASYFLFSITDGVLAILPFDEDIVHEDTHCLLPSSKRPNENPVKAGRATALADQHTLWQTESAHVGPALPRQPCAGLVLCCSTILTRFKI